MISTILAYYASLLDDYLSNRHHQPEGMADAGFIGAGMTEKHSKMVISLINVERETAGGISAPVQRSGAGYTRQAPPLLLNLNLMIAAVYEERRYVESLSLLSDTLKFIQAVPKIEIKKMTFTVEIVNLSPQDLNNIWTMLGGQYYPSVVCKLRGLVIDSEDITNSGSTVKKTEIKL